MYSKVAAVIALLDTNLAGNYTYASPVPMPDNALFPYITVQSIMEQEMFTHDGPSGLGPSIIQINCLDKNYEAAASLRQAIISLLSNYAGISGDRALQGSNFMYAHETYDAEREIHMLHSRFRFWFETDSV